MHMHVYDRLTRWTFAVILLFASGTTRAETPAAWAAANVHGLLELYQHFHRHPELSFHERETADRLASEWERAGYGVHRGVGGHGVVAVLQNGQGPKLMLRTDLDALPVKEETGLVYASRVEVTLEDGTKTGVMHACGHDLHMTNLVGVARYLAGHRDAWQGTLVLIGQPAEERGAGAKAMLDDGLYTRFPKPDYVLALHCDATLPTGTIGYRLGYALANVDSVDVILRGRGGHGAYPHATVDPIVMAARFILDVQTIMSREMEPTEPGVVTVGAIHGGTKHNVIPDSCHLQITVRSFSDTARKKILAAIDRKARAAAAASGGPEPEIALSEGTPALFNSADLAQLVLPAIREVLGGDRVVETKPTMGGEDFSRYAEGGVPVLMLGLGTVEPQRLASYARFQQLPPSLHSSQYYPDAEPALVTGISALSSAALRILAKP